MGQFFGSVENDALKRAAENHGLFYRDRGREYNQYARLGFLDVYDRLDSCREYLFFTKPDLNIYAEMTNDSKTIDLQKAGEFDPNLLLTKPTAGRLHPALGYYPYFVDIDDRIPEVLASLQASKVGDKNPCMTKLSNRVINTLDLPSVTTENMETSSNIFGTRIYHRKTSVKSDENFDFTLEFSDNANLEIYHIFKAWNDYNTLKNKGILAPAIDHIINKEDHSKISIYKLVVDEDGITIRFWAKLIGCYPTGVPREAFSDPIAGVRAYSVPWHADFVVDNNPMILADLNATFSGIYGKNSNRIPLYDRTTGMVNRQWCNAPRIGYDRNKKNNYYKSYALEWV